MPVYRLTKDAIIELPKATYAERGVKERADLQRLLKANIGVVAPDVLVISEEFGEWEDSKRRIDLLGVDRDASLVVIELKRDDEGGHMELQAIRYAAMVSRMTFQRAVKAHQAYLDKSGTGGNARSAILEFLRTSEPPRDDAVLDVRIVLVAADFAKELTTAVLWLNEWELDIRCVKVKPYSDGDGTILEVQQVVPLPEAAEYQVSIREEAISRREVARESGKPTGYWFMNTGDGSSEGRSWEDCKKYGFMLAGGGERWIRDAQKLKVGDKLFAYLSGHGYVGFGVVTAEAAPMKDFVPAGQSKPILELPLTARVQRDSMNDPSRADWCAAVRWIRAVDRDKAVLKSHARRSTLEQIKKPELVADLLRHFGVAEDEA
jgi:hypothetical protein